MNGIDRPLSITLICICGIIGSLASLLVIGSPAASQFPMWYPVLIGVSAVCGIASMVGMWLMKKWGVLLYTGLFVAAQALMLALGAWRPMSLLLPLIVIAIGFANFADMD